MIPISMLPQRPGTRLCLVLAPALLLALVAGCAAHRSAPPDAALRDDLEALFGPLHRRGLFDGAVVIGRGGEILWERGYGHSDAERSTPFTPDTPTDGASLAKTFTAALVLMLASEGLLDLDAPAQRLLPELPYGDLTLRHLLTHTNGLPDYGYFDPLVAADAVRTTETLLAVLAAERPPLAFPPGTAFEYSSLGFDLAALAAGRAAAKPYAQLFTERLFTPLGLTSAFLRPGRLADFPQPRTVGYRRVGAAIEPHEVFDLEAFHGGSNVYLSARDLHRWNTSFLVRPVLASAPLAAALAPARVGEAPSGLTLGSWYRTGAGDLYWYSGHLQGFHAEVLRDMTDRWSIVYVTNNSLPPWLQKGVVRAVRELLAGGRPEPLAPPAVDALRPGEHAALAGVWALAGGETLTVDDEAGHPRLLVDGVGYRMVAVAPEAFYVPGVDLVLGFARDEGGLPARIHVSSNVEERWGDRVGGAR